MFVGVGDDGDLDGELSEQRGDGEADAVDGDRAFGYDVAPEIFGNMHAVAPAFALGLQARDAAGCVDVTEDEMAAEFFAGSQGLFEIDARALVEAGGAGAERVLRTVSPERSAEKRSFSSETTVRQQPLTAMLLEMASEPASVGAWIVTRPPASPTVRAIRWCRSVR